MKKIQLKICGMKYHDNILNISSLNPDYMGFIFWEKSKRNIELDSIPEIPKTIKKVGVFVDASINEINSKIKQYELQIIQLHGNESVEFVKDLSGKTDAELWKVVSVGDQIDWGSLESFLPFVNKFLFDTATATHGGSGKRFDWRVLKTYPFHKSFLLSGGLDEQSAEEVLALRQQIPQLQGVDLNSKFEDAPGLKNIEKLKNFKSSLMHSGINN